MTKTKKFDILSPDGFSIFPGRTYKNEDEKKKAIDEFSQRFKMQGYYSTCRNGYREQIALENLAEECTIQPL